MSWFKDVFIGKEKTKTLDVGIAIATLTTDTSQYFVTMSSKEWTNMHCEPFMDSAAWRLKQYLKGCTSFIEADGGKLVPVNRVKSVSITETPKMETFTWR